MLERKLKVTEEGVSKLLNARKIIGVAQLNLEDLISASKYALLLENIKLSY